ELWSKVPEYSEVELGAWRRRGAFFLGSGYCNLRTRRIRDAPGAC
ncbi:hypothetical protein A2U01_0055583, partial [Trifolium medium]|nr:hypothetical protein [Trifolium medium]